MSVEHAILTNKAMGSWRYITCAVAISAFLPLISARAVNISNTWMLPEEGFPVFYRYFRDRISWYEADAVCQFHHANLVTAQSTSKFDAIRAYLKELDISENVWIGLSRPSGKTHFTWSNSVEFSGEGHWLQSIPVGNEAICAAIDPTADYFWKPLTCGGPEVASFICELPVPSWATGLKGCLLTELPSLTVLYIPEQGAIELTSDCGLDGTKRIACKGNADRENMLKQLSCLISNEDFDDKSTKPPTTSNTASEVTPSDENRATAKTTHPWLWTSNTIDGLATRHRRETDNTVNPQSTKTTTDLSTGLSRLTSPVTASPFGGETTPLEASSRSYEVTSGSQDIVESGADKSLELTATHSLTTQDANTRQEDAEMGGLATATAETKLEDPGEDTAEYPSAINQGQLFSIIENGTMFDIIELNETGEEETKKLKEIFTSSKPLQTSEKSTQTTEIPTTSTRNSELYTTVLYNKEPTADTTLVTNKSLKKTAEKSVKKHLIKDSDPKKSNFISDKERALKKENKNKEQEEAERIDPELTQETAMFPVTGNSEVKLNRTFRKELPRLDENILSEKNEFDMNDSGNNYDQPKVLNVIRSSNADENHKHVEIKLHDGDKNSTRKSFFITTKRIDKTKPTVNEKYSDISTTISQYENIELSQDDSEKIPEIDSKLEPLSTSNPVIDPDIERLNKNVTLKNNESELFIPMKPKKIDLPPNIELKKEPLMTSENDKENEEVSLITDIYQNQEIEGSSQDPLLEIEPEAQPRPNRQRQLTRPQRRSFYPYFFSRVLG